MNCTLRILSVVCFLSLFSCKKHSVSEDSPGNIYSAGTSKGIITFLFRAIDNPALSEDVAGAISGDTIMLTVPAGTNVISLIPAITHSGVSISPAAGVAQNFSSLVRYTVTAEDKTQKTYSVVVKFGLRSTLYQGCSDGKLYALDAADGSLKWTYGTAGSFTSSGPFYDNGTLYIGNSDYYLYAIDAQTGLLKWRYLTYGDIGYSNPVVGEGKIYFTGGNSQSSQGFLYALDAVTGSLVWENQFAYTPANPTFYNGFVYFISLGGLYSVDAMTGNESYTYNTSLSHGNPLTVNGKLYDGTENTVVSAYDISTGLPDWNYADPAATISNRGSGTGPTLHGGKIFNGGYTKKFYALDSATGTLKWIFPGFGSSFFSPATVANGLVYTGDASNIYAIGENSGNLLWSRAIPTTTNSTTFQITVKGNMVFSGSTANIITALDAYTGAIKWQYTTGGATQGAACVVTSDGKADYAGISGGHQ